MDWNAVIEATAARDDTFRAVLRDVHIEIISCDPEHDLCHEMIKAGLADGPIQFWRGATPSLRYRSVHRTAAKRIELGEKFPYRRVLRRNISETERASIAGGENRAGGYETAWEAARGCTSTKGDASAESQWKIEYVFVTPKYDEDGNVISQKPSAGVRVKVHP